MPAPFRAGGMATWLTRVIASLGSLACLHGHQGLRVSPPPAVPMASANCWAALHADAAAYSGQNACPSHTPQPLLVRAVLESGVAYPSPRSQLMLEKCVALTWLSNWTHQRPPFPRGRMRWQCSTRTSCEARNPNANLAFLFAGPPSHLASCCGPTYGYSSSPFPKARSSSGSRGSGTLR